MSDWFERITGFRETSSDDTRARLECSERDGSAWLRSRVTGAEHRAGRFEMASLADLRARRRELPRGRLRAGVVEGDVLALHADEANAGALFQVASQFNCLEMTSPGVTPEEGVTRYAFDPTQGPACARAAGAATIWRNDFVPWRGRIGQSADHQLDGLEEIGRRLGNEGGRLWAMRNGYALATAEGLAEIARRLGAMTEDERDDLRAALHVGLQHGAAVTLPGARHVVTQAFCSALPVAYSEHAAAAWEPFARLVLEAAYEATLRAAVASGVTRVLLTRLGGGAFGNAPAWIDDAIRRALALCRDEPLDVRLVTRSEPETGRMRAFIEDLRASGTLPG